MTVKEFFEMIANANYCKMYLGEGTKYLVKILSEDGEQIGIDTESYNVFVKIIKDNFKTKEVKSIIESEVCGTKTKRRFKLSCEENLYLYVD